MTAARADPTVGFYAIFGQTNIAGLTSSDIWGAVFDFGVEDEVLHEAAIDNVLTFIPEPGTGLLLGSGLLGLAFNGRRRRLGVSHGSGLTTPTVRLEC